jgi:hypothetical protein
MAVLLSQDLAQIGVSVVVLLFRFGSHLIKQFKNYHKNSIFKLNNFELQCD